MLRTENQKTRKLLQKVSHHRWKTPPLGLEKGLEKPFWGPRLCVRALGFVAPGKIPLTKEKGCLGQIYVRLCPVCPWQHQFVEREVFG